MPSVDFAASTAIWNTVQLPSASVMALLLWGVMETISTTNVQVFDGS